MSISSGARPDWLPVNIPYPSKASEGVTIATLDKAGNLTIKVDQPSEPPVRPIRAWPEDIAYRIWDEWDEGYGRASLVEAIAAAIRAERN